MDFTVLTLFPELIDAYFHHGMFARGVQNQLVTGHCINIRDFSTDRHHTVDDKPYGGGRGMVMKPEPLKAALSYAKSRAPQSKVVLMTPQGNRFNQDMAVTLAGLRQ